MAKRYFAPRKPKNEVSLGKIIAALCVVFAALYAGSYVYNSLGGSSPGGEVEASAFTNLDRARDLLEKGDLADAEALVAPLLRGKDPAFAPQAMLLQAEILLASARTDDALSVLEAVRTGYRASPEYPLAQAKYARVLEDRGQITEAVSIYEDLRQTTPPPLRAEPLLGLARHAERNGAVFEARALYQEAKADARPNTAVWDEAVDALGAINVAAIFSREATPDSRVYTVKSGDNLTSIGAQLNTTQGLLLRANGLEESSILRVGDQLKHTPRDFRIVIERSTCRLFLMDGDGLFKRYYVGLGMPTPETETALGRYAIGDKIKDPTWFKPGANPIPPGDPENELGTRWLPLVPREERLPTDLGIHGTIAPETIGQYKSRGCPRMLNEEVEELYDLVVRSTIVEIVDVLPDNFFD